MIVRRSASLALAALMLQLTVARADVACAAHSSLSRSAEAVPQQQGSGGHHSDHGAPADTKQKCDTPSQPDCCQVLVSCSVVLDVGVRIQGACTTLPRVTVAVALADLPPSRVAAPDPPPPKA